MVYSVWDFYLQKIDIGYLFNKKKLWKTMLPNMDKWSLIYPTML